jgi:signal transduction histidine kinase
VREELEACHNELTQQHTQISLFLESLFREEHFRYGHLVLKPGKCFVEQDIILPQLELYASRFAAHGIMIDKPRNMFEQVFPLMLDVGLLSQVYANLFSNAIKYTSEIIDHRDTKRKALAYGCEEVPDFPVPGLRGVKFNVFTTGPPLSHQECEEIFLEGRRGLNHNGIHGTGHGLAFIRRVIEAHGGEVGCEPTEEGNNFYFILPLSGVDD